MAKKVKKQRYLPDDIILQILQLLPSKSLLRFTCVSKSWNSLITSLSGDNYNTKDCSHLLYLANESWKPHQDAILTGETSHDLPHLPLRGCKVVGFCEGLICLTKGSDIYIWNPLIGRLKKVPGKLRRAKHLDCILGFGFIGGDHRVVKMSSIDPGFGPSWVHEVEIYSMASDTWRKLQDCGFLGGVFSSPFFFNGCIYWLAVEYHLILRFDMAAERFDEIATPPQLRYRRNQIMDLVAVNGFLVALKVKPGKSIRVWAYVYSESEWSEWAEKSVVLPRDTSKRLLTVTKDGHIILEGTQDQRIFACDGCYDHSNNSFGFDQELRDLGIHRTSKRFYFISMTRETLKLIC